MAGDWLKFEKATPDKPEVFAIAATLGIDPDAVVGKLMRVWSWFDTHTIDGNAPSVTPELLDRIAGVAGFVTAMSAAEWIVVGEHGLELPNFDRHNGKTSKKRALTAKRVANHRSGSNAGSVTGSVTHALAREEKRREENKEPIERQAALSSSRFDEFWSEYPVKRGKVPAQKSWKRKNLDKIADKIIADVKARKERDAKWKAGFIPDGSTYVSQERWHDDMAEAESAGGDFMARAV